MNAESLIRTLRAYDVSLDAAAVRAAISASNSTHLVHWATLHLTPDTLLTVDELRQFVGPHFFVIALHVNHVQSDMLLSESRAWPKSLPCPPT
jgi:hypothetical protein